MHEGWKEPVARIARTTFKTARDSARLETPRGHRPLGRVHRPVPSPQGRWPLTGPNLLRLEFGLAKCQSKTQRTKVSPGTELHSMQKSRMFTGMQKYPAPNKGEFTAPGNKSKITRHERNRKIQLTMRGKNIYQNNPERTQMLEAADEDRDNCYTRTAHVQCQVET